MKIDDVDRVLDEINDQADQMRQIQDAMGQPIGMAADYDEDDLLGELEVGAGGAGRTLGRHWDAAVEAPVSSMLWVAGCFISLLGVWVGV